MLQIKNSLLYTFTANPGIITKIISLVVGSAIITTLVLLGIYGPEKVFAPQVVIYDDEWGHYELSGGCDMIEWNNTNNNNDNRKDSIGNSYSYCCIIDAAVSGTLFAAIRKSNINDELYYSIRIRRKKGDSAVVILADLTQQEQQSRGIFLLHPCTLPTVFLDK